MKIFIDSANIKEIESFISWGICDGVTTNPSINLSAGIKGGMASIRNNSENISRLIGNKPLSVETTTENPIEMIKQAKDFSSWDIKNLVVKIPITTSRGEPLLDVIHNLTESGIQVNTTAMMTLNQLMLATKAGSRYVSLFAGRIDDEGNDAIQVLSNSRKWLDIHDYKAEIIVGSTRTTKNVTDLVMTGAHVITIIPSVLRAMVLNARTKETVMPFTSDALKSMKEM